MIYLDNNASTPVDPQVLESMLPFLQHRYGNASSTHSVGRAASRAVDDARERVAGLLSVRPSSVVWTSGATEALNTILKGLAGGSRVRRRFLYATTEHKAVTDTLRFLGDHSPLSVEEVPVRPNGTVDLDALSELLDDEVLAVCVMAANNETGVLADLDSVAAAAHELGVLFVCDATQLAGKLPVDLSAAGVDYAAVSAHKLYGPQGVGALVAQPTLANPGLEPLIHGGGHQGGVRSGTLNVAGIVGFGTAAEVAANDIAEEASRLSSLRDRLERLLEKDVSPVTVQSSDAPRLPNTTNLRIHGVDADALIVNCPEVAFSSGSACTSAVPTPSHVLTAMGIAPQHAEESIRLSLGRFTTEAEIEQATERISEAARRIREVAA